MAQNIGEASCINVLVRYLAQDPGHMGVPDADQVRAAARTLLKGASKVLGAGYRPEQVDQLLADLGKAPKVEVLHSRDPDEGCDIVVFVNDVRADSSVEDIDPGRGHSRADWNERIRGYDGDETAFGKMAQQWLVQAGDSQYITGEDDADDDDDECDLSDDDCDDADCGGPHEHEVCTSCGLRGKHESDCDLQPEPEPMDMSGSRHNGDR